MGRLCGEVSPHPHHSESYHLVFTGNAHHHHHHHHHQITSHHHRHHPHHSELYHLVFTDSDRHHHHHHQILFHHQCFSTIIFIITKVFSSAALPSILTIQSSFCSGVPTKPPSPTQKQKKHQHHLSLKVWFQNRRAKWRRQEKMEAARLGLHDYQLGGLR